MLYRILREPILMESFPKIPRAQHETHHGLGDLSMTKQNKLITNTPVNCMFTMGLVLDPLGGEMILRPGSRPVWSSRFHFETLKV
jgi:hypothetical protein